MKRQYDPTLLEEGLGALTIGANLITSPLTRRWYARWGATSAEITRPLPGDDLVPGARLTTTRAITIHAPAMAIWPWLVQMGQGRGGLYTFQRLENLARCQMANVNDVRPELQALAPGDKIRLGPEGYPYYTVHDIHPEQTLILVSAPDGGSGTLGTWVFHLEPIQNATRLIVRSRLVYPPTATNRLIWRGITDPIFFVMERRMMIGIRDRAEDLAASAQTRLA